MTAFLLSVAIEATKTDSYSCLIAAVLPPFLYLFFKKEKSNWLQRLLIKKALKRAGKKEMGTWGKFFLKLLICLAIFGLLLIWLDFGIAAAIMLGVGWLIMAL